jgi:hypothetical protein
LFSETRCKEITCNDTRDNDRDNLTDCADPDCLNQVCDASNHRCNSSGQCL